MSAFSKMADAATGGKRLRGHGAILPILAPCR